MLLSLRGITKKFGATAALRDASLDVHEGEIHLLMGENGAGKSTLMKIAAGLQRRDAGDMLWRGKPVWFASPSEAAAHGVAMVHQESLLAPHLTVAENIFLGRERSKAGWIDKRASLARASALIAEHGFPLNPSARVETLTPAGKQLVEICRAVAQGSSLLIFDEPTSSLADTESREVIRIVRDLAKRNMAVIYITHRLEELRSLGDRVTVLRDGTTVHTGDLKNLTRDALIQYMVGRPVHAMYQRKAQMPGDTLLRVEGLCRGFVRDISFAIRAGEIVGLAGLMGAGRTELCRALFGVDRAERGTIEIAGVPVRPRNPRQAVAAGIALIPEDRQYDGLLLKLPMAANLSLPDLDCVSRFGMVSKRKEANLCQQYRARLGIQSSGPAQIAGNLSGGNQQKLVIAKWMARGARVFLFDEPTRGIDVQAKQEVFEAIDRLAASGAAILMVSSEISELVQVADRILVLAQGRLTGELPGRTTPEAILQLAAPSGNGKAFAEYA